MKTAMARWLATGAESAGARALAVVATLVAAWAAGAASAPATPPPEVQEVVVSQGREGLDVRLKASARTPAQPMVLTGPDRLVIDFPQARAAPAWRLRDNAEAVARIRHGALPGGGVRVVLDLSQPARLATAASVRLGRNGEGRVVAALAAPPRRERRPEPPQALAQAPTKAAPRVAARPPLTPVTPARAAGTGPIVVIDAGHGGRDPGAIGRFRGIHEKDVTLAAARHLRDVLQASGRYRVVMTRNSDRFLELEERLQIARANNADLFISLHADSNPNPNARGASVYTLSERGVNRARHMIDRYDWVIDVGDEARPAIVQDILVDLTQRETTNRSADFAQTLIPRLGRATPLLRNTHRNAGFFVLLAPDVPAVLIELGFLTNREDETRLAQDRRLRRKASAIGEAVDAYFASRTQFASR